MLMYLIYKSYYLSEQNTEAVYSQGYYETRLSVCKKYIQMRCLTRYKSVSKSNNEIAYDTCVVK